MKGCREDRSDEIRYSGVFAHIQGRRGQTLLLVSRHV